MLFRRQTMHRTTSGVTMLIFPFVVFFFSRTALTRAEGASCTTVTEWSDLVGAFETLGDKDQQTLQLCPFDIKHNGNEQDAFDLYTEGLTVVCDEGSDHATYDMTTPVDNSGSRAMESTRCTIRGNARHLNIMADTINIVGITFVGSQYGAVAVGNNVSGTTFYNCNFHDNIRVVGDGGALVLGKGSRGNLLVRGDFNGNAAWGGGAVSGESSEIEISECTFKGNSATLGVGGAIKLIDASSNNESRLLGEGGKEDVLFDDHIGEHAAAADKSLLRGEGPKGVRELSHKSRGRSRSKSAPTLVDSNPDISASVLRASNSNFMSNIAAIEGPAIYHKSAVSGTITSRTSPGGNYGCANLSLQTSKMCNGYFDGENCVGFESTCDESTGKDIEGRDGGDELLGTKQESEEDGGGNGLPSDSESSKTRDDGSNEGDGEEEERTEEKLESMNVNEGTDEVEVVNATTSGALVSGALVEGVDMSQRDRESSSARDGGSKESNGEKEEEKQESITMNEGTDEVERVDSTTPGDLVEGVGMSQRDGGITGISDDFGPDKGPIPTKQPSLEPTTPPPTTPQPSASPTDQPTFLPTSFPTYSPTMEPTVRCNMDEVSRHSAIIVKLEQLSSATDLRRTSTPQGRAVDWLVFEDSLYLCPNDPHLLQRYALAVLYYSTGGDVSWKTCSRFKDISNACHGMESRYLSDNHECNWKGVGCDTHRYVTKVAFEDNSLDGIVPTEIGALSRLRTLRMERGKLHGTIPNTIGDLTKLEKLDLDFNSLEGPLPSSIGGLTNLKLIDLNNNDLTGSLGPLKGLTNLFFVHLQSNHFSGTVPEELSWSSQLQVFAVQENLLTGSIALGFCALRIDGQLQYLEADCSNQSDGGLVDCVCCTTCYPRDESVMNFSGNEVPDMNEKIQSIPPSSKPTTAAPTGQPTKNPTLSPTAEPTPSPTLAPTEEPTYAPTTFTSPPTAKCGGVGSDNLRQTFVNSLSGSGISTKTSLLSVGSSQHEALTWILFDDPMQLCPEDDRIVQRYLAALLYYSTNGDQWYDKGVGQQKFLGSAGECNWIGLKCNSYGEISHIEFESNGVGGTLPYEIGSLTNLEVLSIEKGELGGKIPNEIGNLKQLQRLDLDFNALTGTLPSSLQNAKKLSVIDLNSNMLTGDISALSGVREAYFLQLHNNRFTGGIPASLGNLSNLQVLTIHKNDIEGIVPLMVCNRMSIIGGNVEHLWADCAEPNPKVSCSCCTKCF